AAGSRATKFLGCSVAELLGLTPSNRATRSNPATVRKTRVALLRGARHLRHLFALVDHLHGGCRTGIAIASADRFRSSAEAIGEEILGAGVEVDRILGAREAVSFVAVDDVGDRAAVLLDGVDDLLRLRLVHARIVRALPDEERLL